MITYFVYLGPLYVFFLLVLAKGLSVLFVLSKDQLLVSSIIFFFFCLFLMYVHSDLWKYIKKRQKPPWVISCLYFMYFHFHLWASLVVQILKNLPAMQETRVWSLGQEDSFEREWLPTPVFLPGEFHGQRSLVGCSPWGHKELDMRLSN